MLPAIIIIGVMLFDVYVPKNRILVLGIVLLSLFLNEFFVGGRSRSFLFLTHSSLKADIELAKEINKVIPEESGVYVFCNMKLYYLCHFNPANPKKYGFAYSNALTFQDFIESLSSAEFTIVHKDDLIKNHFLIDRTIKINDAIIEAGLQKSQETDNYLIYKKNLKNGIYNLLNAIFVIHTLSMNGVKYFIYLKKI